MGIPRIPKPKFNRQVLSNRSVSHENQLQIMQRDIFGRKYADDLYHYDFKYLPPPKMHHQTLHGQIEELKDKIKCLEEGMSLLLDHFNLEVKNQAPKILAEKKKKTKS